MSETTPLDLAHAAMLAAPEDETARLGFYERLADSELFLLLTGEPQGGQISPQVFETPEGRFVLVFDREERLSQFAGDVVDFAALSGRGIASMLAGQEIGLGVNLDVAPSAILLPPIAITWLQDTLQNTPEKVEAQIEEIHPPAELPDVLLRALDQKLATATGLAACAYLVGLQYQGGGRGHLLGFVDVQGGAEAALAKAVNEALVFSGLEAGALDVGFFAASDPITAGLARQGLRVDLPKPEVVQKTPSTPPGSDPEKPPKLK